jgi:hypothetical protein
MSNLFSKDEDLLKSAPFTGARILKLFEESKHDKISIFEVTRKLRKNRIFSVRTVYFGMIFLHSLDLIDFEEPYLVLK